MSEESHRVFSARLSIKLKNHGHHNVRQPTERPRDDNQNKICQRRQCLANIDQNNSMQASVLKANPRSPFPLPQMPPQPDPSQNAQADRLDAYTILETINEKEEEPKTTPIHQL